ncbi:zinc chelation protein SecC [Pseudomonas tumuqii]|uniref:zinc chelation protein SecC n=1 Tax=Pseudomonas tumuqii TaxID=2715755 RepID=UPI0015557AAE|nr:zinc chelation protein SecC [Pseudomonas tumuqii]
MSEDVEVDDMEDMVSIALAMAAAGSCVHVGNIAQNCNRLVRDIRRFHPVKLAASFGGLLTQPSLQTSCLRLEVLVHLSIAFGNGPRAGTGEILTQGFAVVGNSYGNLEDPPEDIFVGNIASKRGNYLVLEGVWEGSTFYLQRFVNLVDTLPEGPFFSDIADSVHSLLKLSDLVCRRAGLKRNALGGESRSKVLPNALARRASELRGLVQFSLTELADAGVDVDSLAPFVFDGASRSSLLSQSISHTDLERRPLAFLEQKLFVVLPTAVSPAIRRYFIERLGSGKNRQPLLHHLGREYSLQLQHNPMLGHSPEPYPFFHAPWGSMCCTSMRVDEGRYLILAFVLDSLEGFEEDSFGGFSMSTQDIQHEISRTVTAMQNDCAVHDDFRDGVALVVVCGVGRGAALIPLPKRDRWETAHISIADFCTLSWSKDMKPLQLWRLFKMQKQLCDMGVWLQNMNGLLNLVAWTNSLDGHLVPHGDIPAEAVEQPLHLAIQQNALLDLRHEVLTTWDFHVAQYIDSTWLTVQTEGRTLFEEDKQQPVYGCLDDHGRSGILGACTTEARTWWFEITSPVGDASTSSFDRWRMLGTWCARAVPHFEVAFGKLLGDGPILWRCVFVEPPSELDPSQPGGTASDAEGAISLAVNTEARIVELTIGPKFDLAIFNPDNVAEAALVLSFIRGVAQLAKQSSIDHEQLLHSIVLNAQARQSHAFAAREFRDFIPEFRNKEPIVIGSYEDGATKLGLGWKVRDRALGGLIEGKEQCIIFLNSLVRCLEDELCEQLRAFNRESVLSTLLINHEVAGASRDHWHRTSAAVLALRKDPVAALGPMRDHEMKLNAVFQCSRTLLEMAICECSAEEGLALGELDLTLFMAKASQIYHFGGWSDLAHWGFLEPRLIVQPLGDVHANHDFIDTVLDGFSSASSEVRFMASARRYERNLQMPNVNSKAQDQLEAKFVNAWYEDFGVELDAIRRFLDAVEDWAIELKQPIITVRRSALEAMADDVVIGAKIVAAFSLLPRSSWRDLPEGYDEKDIAAWRFRRRLSALRRPLLQLSSDEDPDILIAPGLLREGFAYTVGNYFYGSYPDRHLGPAMRKYAGHARQREGMGFNLEVAQKMGGLGWETQTEVTLTKILRKALDRNYGDVDVLAWDPVTHRILVMECKDLQFRKTHGEIAEQLTDFAGEVKPNGKPDLLRKHLDRVEVLRAHQVEVCNFLGVDSSSRIESHLVFRNPVPMQHVAGRHKDECTLLTFADLESLRVN